MNKVLAVNLYKALKNVKRTKISSLPVLNHAKMQFTNGELIVTTTDLENPVQEKVSCILNEEWSTCVLMVHKVETGHDENGYTHKIGKTYKYYPFLDFVKLHAEYQDVLEFTFNPEVQIMTVRVQGERNTTEFKCMDALEFPCAETLQTRKEQCK